MDILIGAVTGLIIGLIILAIITLIFRWLWNTTMPDVFGLKSLTFGQSFKILLIASMLFGGGTKLIERGHEVVPDDVSEQTAG
jgi:high-affinity Fe2+/Pb2+ permease